MSEEEKKEIAESAPAKRRGGRQPMSPEKKEAAARARAEKKAMADKLQPAYILQYQDREVTLDELAEAAKAAFKAEKKRTPVTELKIYVKPEEHAAYYVVNDSFSGKLDF